MVKTLSFQYRGYGFDPWSGNQDPTQQEAKKKKKKKQNGYVCVCVCVCVYTQREIIRIRLKFKKLRDPKSAVGKLENRRANGVFVVRVQRPENTCVSSSPKAGRLKT